MSQIIRKQRNRKFFDYLESYFSAAEYKNLGEMIGADRNRIWRLRGGKASFQLKELKALANRLNKSIWHLVKEYGVGADTITLDQMNALLAEEGNTLGIVSHAA